MQLLGMYLLPGVRCCCSLRLHSLKSPFLRIDAHIWPVKKHSRCSEEEEVQLMPPSPDNRVMVRTLSEEVEDLISVFSSI